MSTTTFRGRVALVTGADAAPGAALVEALTAAGASVAAASDGSRAGGLIRRRRNRAALLHLDPRDDLSWEAALFDVTEAFGRLDVVINAAGAAPVDLGGLSPSERLVGLNLAGACRGTLHAGAALRRDGGRGGGVVGNLASAPASGLAAAAARALAAATEDFDARLAPLGVRVLFHEVDPRLSARATAEGLLTRVALALSGEAERRVA